MRDVADLIDVLRARLIAIRAGCGVISARRKSVVKELKMRHVLYALENGVREVDDLYVSREPKFDEVMKVRAALYRREPTLLSDPDYLHVVEVGRYQTVRAALQVGRELADFYVELLMEEPDE